MFHLLVYSTNGGDVQEYFRSKPGARRWVLCLQMGSGAQKQEPSSAGSLRWLQRSWTEWERAGTYTWAHLHAMLPWQVMALHTFQSAGPHCFCCMWVITMILLTSYFTQALVFITYSVFFLIIEEESEIVDYYCCKSFLWALMDVAGTFCVPHLSKPHTWRSYLGSIGVPSCPHSHRRVPVSIYVLEAHMISRLLPSHTIWPRVVLECCF